MQKTLEVPFGLTVGDWLRAARLGAGLTQDRIGELIGVTDRTVANWEAERSGPPWDCVMKWVRACGYHRVAFSLEPKPLAVNDTRFLERLKKYEGG